jgi:hypothetical protein
MDLKVGTGSVCCEILRSLLQTLRVHIYTLSLTRLLVDHDCSIYCLKLTTWRHVGFVSIINPLPSLYPVHVITHSRMFLLSTILPNDDAHSRPQTLLPNVLKELSCRMVLSCQIRPICQSPLVPILVLTAPSCESDVYFRMVETCEVMESGTCEGLEPAKIWNLKPAKFWKQESAKFGELMKIWFGSRGKWWSSWKRDSGIRKEQSQRRHLKSVGLRCELVASL